MRPIDPDDPDVRKLAYIDLARQRGIPWKTIAATLGLPDKRAAKRVRADLARRVKIKQLAPDSTGPSPG